MGRRKKRVVKRGGGRIKKRVLTKGRMAVKRVLASGG